MDEMTLTLNSPLTEEQWDAITDVDFDHTDRIWFQTKHGKRVEFAKRAPDFKTKLLTYLETKMNEYTPKDIDINGRWVGGNEELFYFVKELIRKVEGWT